MGRKPKYITPEEKRQARNLRRMRYYERHKEIENMKSLENYYKHKLCQEN